MRFPVQSASRSSLWTRLVALAGLAALAACELVPATNPFDPQTTPDRQQPGTLTGTIVLDNNASSPEALGIELAVIRVRLRNGDGQLLEDGGEPRTIDLIEPTVLGAIGSGTFVFDKLVPDSYTVDVVNVASFYNAPNVSSVRVVAGGTITVDDLRFSFIDTGGGGPGTVDGDVGVEGAAPVQRRVSLFVLEGGATVARRSALTDGHFSFTGLGTGTYAILAEGEGFFPDYRLDVVIGETGEGAALAQTFSGAAALTLHPVTAVVQPTLAAGVPDEGKFYVATDDVEIQLLAFATAGGPVDQMRVSTNASFLDDGGAEVPFEGYNASKTVALPFDDAGVVVDGAVAIFAQFRATSTGGFTFDSPTFTTTVVHDSAAPEFDAAPVLDGLAQDADGTWLATDNALALRFDVNDVTSGIGAVATEVGDTPPESFDPKKSAPGLVRVRASLNAAGDGPTTVWVQVKDRAGNIGEQIALPVLVDSSDPDVTLVVQNAAGGALAGRVAQVSFDEVGSTADKPIAIELRVQGNAFSDLLPYADSNGPLVHDVVIDGRGDGNVVTIEARLIDRVGNAVVVTRDVTLDLKGSVTGDVVAEGAGLITPTVDATVTLLRGLTPVTSIELTGSTGFSLSGIPEGSGYALEVVVDGYVTARRAGIAVTANATVDLEAIAVALARGNLTGRARRADLVRDNSAHAGIAVSAVLLADDGRVFSAATSTDASGAFTFNALPATRGSERYRVEARADDYGSAVGDSVVGADVSTALADLLLARNRGDFDVCRATGPCVSDGFVGGPGVDGTSARIRLLGAVDVVDLLVTIAGNTTTIPIAADNLTPIDLTGVADGALSISLQTRKTDNSLSEVLTSDVVKDTLPPTDVSLERVQSPRARDPRFTGDDFMEFVADATAGAGAPLGALHVAIADDAPEAAPPSACAAGTRCRVALPGADVDAVVEGLHRAHVFVCDLVGNCAAPVSTFVIHDRTPPAVSNGVSFSLVAQGSVDVVEGNGDEVRLLPSAFYQGSLVTGRARDASEVDVVDENGAAVADVFAFRFSLDADTLARAAVQTFSSPPAPDFDERGADVGVPALAPLGTTQLVNLEVLDAAGNVSERIVARVRIDDDGPVFSPLVNLGARASATSAVPVSIAVANGAEAPSVVSLAVDNGAPGDVNVSNGLLPGGTTVNLGVDEGTHTVTLIGRDLVGNASTFRSDVVLDRTGPRLDAAVCNLVTCLDDGAGVLLVNGGEAEIDLTIVASDLLSAVTQVEVSVGAAAPRLFAVDGARDIGITANGSTTVSVVALDAVGNRSNAIVRSVTHDASAPTVTSFTVNGAAQKTNDLRVQLKTTAAADAIEMRFASAVTAAPTTLAFSGPFFVFTTASDLSLPGNADGGRSLCVQVRDAAGNVDDACAFIELDRTLPSGAAEVLVDETNALTVSVRLTYPADTTLVSLSKASQVCESPSVAYIAAAGSGETRQVTLDAGDGTHAVFACFKDGANNVDDASDTVLIDQTPPTAAVSINGNAAFATTTSITATLLTTTDAARRVVQLDGTAPNCAGATFETFSATRSFTLAGEGTHTVFACIEDRAGNRTAVSASSSIILDTVNPVGSIDVNGALLFTNVAQATAQLTRSLDVVAMSVGLGVLDCTSPALDYIAFNPGIVIDLGVDGAKVISACLKDGAGRTSRVQDTITLDRIAPSGTISLPGDTTSVRTGLPVSLVLDGDTFDVAVTAQPTACANENFVLAPPLSPTVDLPLAGTNIVTACLRDRAGNVRAVTDTIFVEDNSGDQLVIAVQNGAATTRDPSRNVVVALFRPSGSYDKMKVAEAATLDCTDFTDYEDFNSAKLLQLSDGVAPFQGTRTVLACVRENIANGNIRSATDTILLDTFAPAGSVVINAAGSSTNNATVTATLSNGFAAQNETITVALSETSTLSGGQCTGSFETFSAAKPFTFSGADGARTVFACLRDLAGNTTEVQDGIALDRQAPAGITIAAPANVTSTTVTTTLNFDADAIEVVLAEGSLECATASGYLPVPGGLKQRDFVVSGVEGSHILLACFRDGAGNTSQTQTTTNLDLTNPTGSVVIQNGATFATSLLSSIAISASEDVVLMQIAEGAAPDCNVGAYVPFVANPNVTLSAGDGVKNIHVCLQDRAGRKAVAIPDSIVLDTTPANPTLVVNDNDAATRSRNVTLSISVGVNIDVVAFAAAETTITCNAANLAYSPFNAVVPFLLSSTDAQKTVLVCLKDAAGNVSTIAGTDAINLDSGVPVGGTAAIVDVAGFLTTQPTVSVNLAWSVANDPTAAKLAESAVDCQTATGYVALPVGPAVSATIAGVPLSAGDGSKLIAVCFKDAAGNVATAQDTTVRDNTAPTVTSVVCTSCTTDGTTTFSTSTTPSLAATSDEAGSGLASARVIVDGGAETPAALTNGVITLAALAAGPHTVRVKLVDNAANISSVAQSRVITLNIDGTAPSTGALALNGGASATNNRLISAILTGTSTDVSQIAIVDGVGVGSLIASCAAASYLPFSAAFTRNLTAGDGDRAVSVCVKDAAGNTSTTPVTASILVDTTVPSLQVVPVDIADGDNFLQGETAIDVVLRWTTVNDARQAKVGEGFVDCSSANGYVNLPAATTATISAVPVSAGDGAKSIAACFKDLAGNVVTASDVTTRDGTAPVVTSVVCTTCTTDGGTVFSKSAALTLAFTTDEAGSGLGATALVFDGVSETSKAVTSGTVSVTGLADGARTLRVRAVDRAGNQGSIAQALSTSLTVDTVVPVLAANSDFGIKGANAGLFTNNQSVAVTLLSVPADATQMAIVEAGALTCATASYLPLSTSFTFNLAGTVNSVRTLQLCLKDRATNTTTTAHTASISFDDAAPGLPASNAVQIVDGGDEFLTSVAGGVSVTLNWNSTNDVAAFKLGENTVDCSSEPYTRPESILTVQTVTQLNFALSAVEGTKVVAACFKDRAGNISTAQDTTALDQLGPTGALALNDGAGFATLANEDVTAVLRMGLDVNKFALSETSATNPTCAAATFNCATATYASFTKTNVNGVLLASALQNFNGGSAAAEGNKCFEACFEDNAGNRSTTAIVDAIVFDKSAPAIAAGDMTLGGLDKNGASQTLTRTPFITVAVANAPADTASFRVSQDSTFAAGTQAFVPFTASAQPFTLSAGEGSKSIFVQLKDNAGNVPAAGTQKTITLDTLAPAGAAIILANGASVTNLLTINAIIQASGASEFKIQTPDNPGDAENFQVFSVSPSTVSVAIEEAGGTSTDGGKTVLVVFRDDAGNESPAASDGIDLDRSGPTAVAIAACASTGVCVNSGAVATNSVAANLTLDATGASEMQIATDGCADTEPFVAFSTAISALLPSTDGTKTVAVRFRDGAGNQSQTFVNCGTTPGHLDTITLDTAAPSGTALAIVSGAAGEPAGFTTTGALKATFTFGVAAGDAVVVKHGEAVDCSTAAGYLALPGASPLVLGDGVPAADTPVPLSVGDGVHNYFACFKDAAGNVSSASSTIQVDRTAPTGTVLLADGAALIGTLATVARLTFNNDVTGVLVQESVLASCPTGAASYAPTTATTNVTLSADSGSKTVFACLRDQAGNVSSVLQDSVTLDVTPPTLTLFTVNGNVGTTTTNSTTVSVVITASDTNGPVTMAISNTPLTCANAAYTTLSASFQHQIPVSASTTINLCLRDGLGVVTASPTTRLVNLDQTGPASTFEVQSAALVSTELVTGTTPAEVAAHIATVNVRLNTAEAGVTRKIANDIVDCSVGSFTALATGVQNIPFVLSTGDGTKTVLVCLKDTVGNITVLSDTIVLDTLAPSASLALDNGAAGSLDNTVTRDFTNVVDVAQTRVFTTDPGTCPAPFTGYTAFVNNANQAVEQGPNNIFVCLADAAGNTFKVSDAIDVDTTDPTITFALQRRGTPSPDEEFTNIREITINTTAASIAVGSSVAVSNTAITCAAPTTSYTPLPNPLPTLPFSIEFALAAGGSDDLRTVTICVKEPSGRTNGVGGGTATINLDTTPPAVIAIINSGDSITNDENVTVGLTTSPVGDLLEQQTAPTIRKDALSECSRASFLGVFGVLPAKQTVQLQNDGLFNDSGTKFLSACFRDRAGNLAAASDDIFFDEDRPVFTSRPVCSGCNLIPTDTLVLGDDAEGFTNAGALVDWELASSADVSFVITMATQDGNTDNGGVGDDKVCTAGDLSRCRVASGETCVNFPVDDTGAPNPPVLGLRCAVVSAPELTSAPLPSVDGQFRMITALQDSAGNFSNNRQVFVVRDTVAPVASFSVSSTTSLQQTVSVNSLTITGEVAIPNVTRIGTFVASSLTTFADSSTLLYTDVNAPFVLSDQIPVNLSAGDGAKTVRVRFTDNAGNVSVDATQAVLLDTTAPTRPLFSTQSTVIGPLSGSLSIALASESTDPGGSGVRTPRNYDLLLPSSVSCGALDGAATETNAVGANCQWSGVAFNVATVALGADGEKRLFVEGHDVAGNVSGQDLVTLTLDSTAPTKPCFASGCATSATIFTNAVSITLNLNLQSTDAHFESYQACTTTAGTCSCTPSDVPGATFTALLSPNATNRVCVRARDEANNVSGFDNQLVVHDDVAPTAPVFTSPLAEVTGAQTLLLFANASKSHNDPNFSHFSVIGGAHLDTLNLCATAVAPLCNTATRTRFFLNGAVPVSLLVDLEPETTNTFSVQAVDRAGNVSGSASVEVFEGSLTIAMATTETPNGGTMAAFGDHIAFSVNDNLLDKQDNGRVLGPGLDLRYGTSDDENVQFATTVLVDPNTAAAFDDLSRQTTPITGGVAGVAFIDPTNDDITHAGALRLRTFGSDTVFNGNDSLIFLTPFPSAAAPSGCGQQKGFRNPSMSQDRIVTSCFFSDTDYDIVMFTPGANTVYEASGAVGRDDTMVSLAETGSREHLPVLSDETAAWIVEIVAGTTTFNVVVKRPGLDGRLGTADDDAGTAATLIPTEDVTQPGLYFPEDPSVPSCQRGVVYNNGTQIIHHNPGVDGSFVATGGDDVRTILEGSISSNGSGALRFGAGVITYDTGFLGGQIVVTPGVNRCFEAQGAGGSDDERITDLKTFGTADITVANAGWFEFSTPGIFQNQVLFHDLLTRRALVDGQEASVGDAVMGQGFALFANGSGNVKIFDFDSDDLVQRSRTDASIFNRAFVSGGGKIASTDEDVDIISVVEAGVDLDLLTGDDLTVRIASDSTGGAVIDNIAGSQRNVGMSTNVVGYLTGVDPDPSSGGYPSANVRLQFAGANGRFELDGDGGGEDDCQANLTTSAINRGFVSVDGVRVAWLDRTVAGTDAGLIQVFEPNSNANPCGAGVTTQLTNGGFPLATMPIMVPGRVAAFETNASGVPQSLLIIDTPSKFKTITNRRRSCTIPTGWTVDSGSDGLAFFEGGAIFVISQGNLRKTAMCDLTSDMVRMIDANQAGPIAMTTAGRTAIMRSFADNTVLQVQLDR